MSTYFEYGVKLTNGQKSKLASAIRNKSPLTLRLKHSHLRGNDELMLTKRQISKIKKSISNGTGTDIKISKSHISRSVKHGGNLFSSLASIGAKVLPYAIKGVSKVAPALATGAVSALGEIGLNKLFGGGVAPPQTPRQRGGVVPTELVKVMQNGITIPKKFFSMLPAIKKELTKSQIDLINKLFQSGGRVYIKPNRRQIEGGFLGTLASIGIPIAISLVSKMLGSGLQVDRQGTSSIANVYVPTAAPPPPQSTYGEGYPYYRYPPPFIGSWNNPIGMGVRGKKKPKSKGRGLLLGKNSPFNSIPIIGTIL